MERPDEAEHVRLLVQGEDGPIAVYLEPEGSEVAVPEGDWLVISFPPPQQGEIEIGHTRKGIVVVRPSGDYPTVTRRDGTEVRW
jgi:hypothetical protein